MSSKRGAGPGRGRGTGPGRGRGRRKNTVAGAKRKTLADPDYEQDSAPKKAKRAPPPPPEPRVPSSRSTRNLEPAGPDMPHAKRPNGAVAADVAAAAAAAADAKAERQGDIAGVAAIDAEQDEVAAQEEEDAVYSLADVPPQETDVDDEDTPVLTFTQEDFNCVEDDDAYLSPPEFEKPKLKVPSKTRKKPTKRETRGEIEEARKLLVAGKSKAADPVGQKKALQESTAAAASKKAGLSKTWKQSLAASSKLTSTPSAESIQKERTTLGGFTDDDALAMVTVVSSDTEETPSKPVEVKTALAKTVRKARPSVKPEPSSKMPALVVDDRQTPKIKRESSSSSYTPESSADVKGLPAFVAATWTRVFLPAAYHILYISDDPMAIGAIGGDMKYPGKATVAILQGVLNDKYPGNTWKMKWGDAICAKAVSRIGERRSAIGKGAVIAVDRKYDGLHYYEDLTSSTPGVRKTALIKSDARYALRKNGPAFYKYPTPENVCLLNPKDPAYIKPKDYLESKIIIDSISQYLTGDLFQLVIAEDEHGKEIVDPSSELPIGALAMAAAAAERAYELHKSGVRVKARDFSSTNVGTAVRGYVTSIKTLSVSRWESLIAACGGSVDERAAAAAEESDDCQYESLDGVREAMYIPSTP
ncbi:hypothetical protein DFH09DRAFT_1341941 [Mycena vulgaris]|nr:hypothetical protein DFH09DRAFT_1341941 [Mycena vulgaris]